MAQCPSVIAPYTSIAAIQALSETMATAQLEAPDSRSHGGILEALAILSRDVRGLMEASFHPGP